MSKALQEKVIAIELEVASLRRTTRRWRAAVLSIVVMAIATALLGFRYQERIVEAEQFILVDAAGNRRAVLGTAGSDAGLLLLTTQGRPAAMFVATDETSQLTLQHPSTQRKIVLTVDSAITQLAQKDEVGRTRLSITSSDIERGSALRLQDGQGTVRAAVGYWPATGPGISIMGESGQIQKAMVP